MVQLRTSSEPYLTQKKRLDLWGLGLVLGLDIIIYSGIFLILSLGFLTDIILKPETRMTSCGILVTMRFFFVYFWFNCSFLNVWFRYVFFFKFSVFILLIKYKMWFSSCICICIILLVKYNDFGNFDFTFEKKVIGCV